MLSRYLNTVVIEIAVEIITDVDLQAAMQSPVLRSVLEDIFLVRRLQTVAEVFAMCAQMACAFKGTGPLALYDDAALCKPVKRYG